MSSPLHPTADPGDRRGEPHPATLRDTARGRGTKNQSLERASAILGYFSVSRPVLTLQEITARSGLTRATAHRYVSVLRDLNLLRLDPATNVYSLGSRIFTLAAAAAAGNPMVRIVGPFMEELVRYTNETAVLTVWDGTAPVVLRVDDNSDRVVRVSIQTGIRLPTWQSAHGRVFCTYLPAQDVPRRPLHPDGAALEDDLNQIRETGVSVNTNEAEGTRAIASPVFASGGRIVGSIGIVGTSASVPAEPDSAMAKSLLGIATRLSSDLGETEPIGRGSP